MFIEEIYGNLLGNEMETLQKICETLDLLTKNEKALLLLRNEMALLNDSPLPLMTDGMKLEKEALDRAQDSLLAHLDFLKNEYQRTRKLFEKMKFVQDKHLVYEKVLNFNRVAKRPLIGYLELFRQSNVQVRKRRISKALAVR